MKKTLIITALLALASLAFAEYKNLPPGVQQNLSAIKKYPKASSIVLWAEEDYVLRSDGSKTIERHEFRYLPDEASRDNWGDPRVNFVAGRDSLMILVARAYTADGRQIDCTPQNAFNPVVPDGLDKAPDFAPYRQMVITLMGLENGCISELHYRVNTPKPAFPWLEGRVYLRDENPMISHHVTVQVPEGQMLNYKVDRGAPEPAISGTTYTWTMTEQPGYDKQDLQGHRILLPNIAFTTAHNWAQIQKELKTRFEAASAGDSLVPASLKEALAGIYGDEDRLDTIKAWTKARFNHLEFDLPDFALSLRPVKEVLASGYGNGLELAMLVSKFANQSGVSTQVMPCFVPEAPVPLLFDVSTAVIARRTQSGDVYSDPLLPREEFSAADLLGYTLIPLDNVKEPPFLFASKVKAPSLSLALALNNLDSDTLTGTGILAAQGEFGIYEAVRAGGAEDYLKNLVHLKGFKTTHVLVKDLESPRHGSDVTLDFSFAAVGALDSVDRYRVLPLSILDFAALIKDVPLSLPSREFRQEVRLPGQMTLHVEAVVPSKWQVKTMPASLTRKWDFDKGMVNASVENNRFTFERTLELSKEWIPPESWSQFRTFLLESGSRPDNSVTFSPK
jgi:hypothetical protein